MSVNQAPLASAASVPVAPTPTVLLAPVDVTTLPALLSATVQNGDGAQTLNAWAEAGPTSSGPFGLVQWADLQGIAPGEPRLGLLDCTGRQWVRLMGTASGAGLTATVWAWRVDK